MAVLSGLGLIPAQPLGSSLILYHMWGCRVQVPRRLQSMVKKPVVKCSHWRMTFVWYPPKHLRRDSFKPLKLKASTFYVLSVKKHNNPTILKEEAESWRWLNR